MLRMAESVSVRLTKTERARVRAAATREGLSVSEWLRRLMARAVDDVPDLGQRDTRHSTAMTNFNGGDESDEAHEPYAEN